VGWYLIYILEIKNICLLREWLFNILNEEGVWQELICNKYPHYLRFQANQLTLAIVEGPHECQK
jgi:hypothetical protein